MLVRCKEIDWATNWRDGLAMVALSEQEKDDLDADHGADEQQREEAEERKLIAKKLSYLREVHAIHSVKTTKKHSLREVCA